MPGKGVDEDGESDDSSIAGAAVSTDDGNAPAERPALPTLRHILRNKPRRVVIATHFGRPKGPDEHHSTARFAPILAGLLGSADSS